MSGNRGEVRRWDRGVYTVASETETRLEILLEGSVLHGRAVLQRRNDVQNEAGPNDAGAWLYRFTVEFTAERTGTAT